MPILIPTAEPFLFPAGRTGCLLIHGFTGTPKEMRLLGEYLASQGYTSLGVRLSGHATRPEDMRRSRWRDWLASVEDGYHLLQNISDQIFVIGLSMGGALAALLASQFPTAGLVIMCSPHHLPKDPRLPFIVPLSWIQPFMVKGAPQWADTEAYAEHVSYQREPTRAFAELRDLLAEVRRNLAQVTVPTLLLYSRQDPTVKASDGHAENYLNELGSQDKRLLWIEDSGHVITRDKKRQQVFKLVTEFIQSTIQAKHSTSRPPNRLISGESP